MADSEASPSIVKVAENSECAQVNSKPSEADVGRTFLVGQRVQIVNLRNRADLNGHQGIIAACESESGLWKVRMDDGTGKMLKECNLEAIQVEAALDKISTLQQQLKEATAAS